MDIDPDIDVDEDVESKSTDWKAYAQCKCGWFTVAGGQAFTDNSKSDVLFFTSATRCTRCGSHKDSWDINIKRWISTSEFWHISTWGRGYWENQDDKKKFHKMDDKELTETFAQALEALGVERDDFDPTDPEIRATITKFLRELFPMDQKRIENGRLIRWRRSKLHEEARRDAARRDRGVVG